jgi:hypothetical protein
MRTQRLTLRGAGLDETKAFDVGIPPCNGTTGGFSVANGKVSRWVAVPFSGSSTNFGEDNEDMMDDVGETKAISL